MDEKKLKYINELLKVIKTTEEAIESIKGLQSDSKEVKDNTLDDGQYNLYISKYKDGSNGVNLNRYNGNAKLIEVIVKELESQLFDYKEEFKTL